MEERGFLEWAHVHDHRYGTLVSEVEDKLAKGSSVILEIDVQGALAVKDIYPDAVLIFVQAPSFEEMERRLRHRGTEDEEEIQIRLATARKEMKYADSYDVVLVNDVLDEAAQRLLNIIESYENVGGCTCTEDDACATSCACSDDTTNEVSE